MTEKEKPVLLVFQPPRRMPGLSKPEIDKMMNWFKDYKVNSIELWVEGCVESGEAISLLVSAEGKGGVKVTLTPKE